MPLDNSGNSLLNIVKYTQSNYKVYKNITRFDNYNNGTGAIAIYTTIPWSAANMLTIQVKGYQYGSGGPFEITFGCYAGEGNFHNPGYTTNNDFFNKEYSWYKDSNNYVVLILGSTSGTYGCQLWVSEYKQGFQSLTTTYADGWSVSKITSTTGLSSGVSIPSRSVISAASLDVSSNATISGYLTISNQPSFQAHRGGGANYTITNGSDSVVLPFNTVRHNTTSSYNTSNYRFTAPIAGKYLFTATVRWDGSSGGSYLRTFFTVNGSSGQGGSSFNYGHQIMGPSGYSSSYQSLTISAVINLAANDYVSVVGGINSGTTDMHAESQWSGQLLG